jgi:RNA polymerase sigma factor (sigma-70 family)
MTTLDDSPRTDLSLVADVRDGWRDAFGELYRRHHAAALRFALMLTGGDDAQAQDLVAEAFARVLRTTSDGGGSTVAFRPYLLSAIRHEYLAELRRSGRVDLVESDDELDGASPNGADDGRFDDPTITSAFRRLPARWRTVLWHTEVKGDKAADVASLMGISPNAAAALAARAREGLRQEYLQEHVAGARRECGPYASRLARLVRGALSLREQQLLEAHLRLCADCSRARSELRGLNGRMRTIFPVIVGAGALWPGQGLPSLSSLPVAAGSGSSWVGSACIAGTGAVVAPVTAATTTAGIGVAGVVTASFAKVAAATAAVVAGSAAAFGFAANPAPIDGRAGDPLVVVTPTGEGSTAEIAVTSPSAGSGTDTSEPGPLANDGAPTDILDLTIGTMEATSSLMAPDPDASEGSSPVGEAGGPPSAPVSTGESPTAPTPDDEQSSSPSSGESPSDSPSPSDGGEPSSGSDTGSSPAPEPSNPVDSPTSSSSSTPNGVETGGSKPGPRSGPSEPGGPSSWTSTSPRSTGPQATTASREAAAARAFVREWRQAHDSRSASRWPGLRWIARR